jgi:hypothetical protein
MIFNLPPEKFPAAAAPAPRTRAFGFGWTVRSLRRRVEKSLSGGVPRLERRLRVKKAGQARLSTMKMQ